MDRDLLPAQPHETLSGSQSPELLQLSPPGSPDLLQLDSNDDLHDDPELLHLPEKKGLTVSQQLHPYLPQLAPTQPPMIQTPPRSFLDDLPTHLPPPGAPKLDPIPEPKAPPIIHLSSSEPSTETPGETSPPIVSTMESLASSSEPVPETVPATPDPLVPSQLTDLELAQMMSEEEPAPPSATDLDDEMARALALSMVETGPPLPSDEIPEEFIGKGAIVQNAINSCYLDSVLVAMFFPKAVDVPLFSRELKDDSGTYLQYMIKTEVIDKIREGGIVSHQTMGMLRKQLIEIGWKDYSEEYDQQDAKEMYEFLMEKLSIPLIKIQRQTFTDGVQTGSDYGKIEELAYLPVNIPEDHPPEKPLRVVPMMKEWFHTNFAEVRRKAHHGDKDEQMMNALNIYKMTNQPPLIGVAINRFMNPQERNNVDLIVQRAYVPFENEGGASKQMLNWRLQAIICHQPNKRPDPVPEYYSPLKSGHYYCLVFEEELVEEEVELTDEKTGEVTTQKRDKKVIHSYRFNDLEMPSLVEVDLKEDRELVEKIKKDAVFVIYREDVPM